MEGDGCGDSPFPSIPSSLLSSYSPSKSPPREESSTILRTARQSRRQTRAKIRALLRRTKHLREENNVLKSRLAESRKGGEIGQSQRTSAVGADGRKLGDGVNAFSVHDEPIHLLHSGTGGVMEDEASLLELISGIEAPSEASLIVLLRQLLVGAVMRQKAVERVLEKCEAEKRGLVRLNRDLRESQDRLIDKKKKLKERVEELQNVFIPTRHQKMEAKEHAGRVGQQVVTRTGVMTTSAPQHRDIRSASWTRLHSGDASHETGETHGATAAHRDPTRVVGGMPSAKPAMRSSPVHHDRDVVSRLLSNTKRASPVGHGPSPLRTNLAPAPAGRMRIGMGRPAEEFRRSSTAAGRSSPFGGSPHAAHALAAAHLPPPSPVTGVQHIASPHEVAKPTALCRGRSGTPLGHMSPAGSAPDEPNGPHAVMETSHGEASGAALRGGRSVGVSNGGQQRRSAPRGPSRPSPGPRATSSPFAQRLMALHGIGAASDGNRRVPLGGRIAAVSHQK